ncbi:MAG: XRE family transcriptional regulator [Bacteroidales bacterium]|jgi:hypothetical protein|nr:XRE family transcriptional regulator [Bacteroidales bacterium]
MQAHTEIHIGALIKAKMHEQGRRSAWLAEKLPCDRSNVYRIFKNPSIDTALLTRISEILGYNFFSHYNT